jgi:hypothetical protein
MDRFDSQLDQSHGYILILQQYARMVQANPASQDEERGFSGYWFMAALAIVRIDFSR